MGGVFSKVDHSVESLPVHGSAATISDGDAPRDHRPNCCGVKGPPQYCRETTPSQPSEVIGPCQVLRDLHPEVSVILCAPHQGPADPESHQTAPLLPPPEAHNHLLGLGHIQVQVVHPPLEDSQAVRPSLEIRPSIIVWPEVAK